MDNKPFRGVPQFYLYDDERQKSDDSLNRPITLPKRLKDRDSISSQKLNEQIRLDSPVMTLRDQFLNKNEILKFPVESSHSYSYAHLSPNSLALRLNVLKRSLEILRDRPNLIKAINTPSTEPTEYFPPGASIPLQRQILNDRQTNLQSNASSAALAALFRPSMKRADSLPVDEMYSQTKPKPEPKNPMLSDDLSEIVKLLDANDLSISNNKDFASTLHELSLSHTPNIPLNKDMLKTKLMYALSTPFVDHSVMTTTSESNNSHLRHPSTVALNILNQNQGPGGSSSRPYHSISSGKHALPQSIFTIEYEPPWNVKAANDLACLMFGVLKGMIKSMTLMDLIAPQFREFVTDRITRSASGLLKTAFPNSDIIFAGEIVAISRTGEQGYAWTSLWAKKRGNLIIFMFDQIPCDAFDVVILKDLSKLDDSLTDFEVISRRIVAGQLIDESTGQYHTLSQVSKSMSLFVNQSLVDDMKDEPLNKSGLIYSQSDKINTRRYFTLHINDENIPCAVTSNPLEMNPNKFEMKLKIHTLPYIAGIFVIDSQSLKIISCNNAIARNLFGWSSLELAEQLIDLIIKDFSHIFNQGINDTNSDVSIVPGLVLPEHFFRRYSCIYSADANSQSTAEESFITSKGITGKHKDGSEVFIDVQLRVSAMDTFVLWVTYSRQSDSSIAPHEVEVKSSTRVDTLKSSSKRARSISGDTALVGGLPSQLRLFDQDTLPTMTGDIVRHNSTRTPKSIHLGKSDEVSHRPISSQSTLTNSTFGSNENYETANSSVDTKFSSIFDSKMDHISYDTEAELELLKSENLLLEQKVRACKSWPKEIGNERRSKKISEFQVIRDMGEGAYGKVILARHKHDHSYEVIIKCIDKERILVDTWVRDRKLGTIPSEIQIMSTLMKEPHPNIMRIIDFFEDEKYYYLETPIFGDPPAIDLFDYIEIKKDMTENECRFIFKQISLALFHLHKHGITHRDIKDENVIVDERGIIKLIDFGSAGYTKLGPFDVFVGTIDYASPEVLRGEKYTGKPQDIWALGILLYTILFKENPFYNVDEIMEGDLRLPNVVSKSAIDLVKSILIRDVDKRPTITDILEHQWLQ